MAVKTTVKMSVVERTSEIVLTGETEAQRRRMYHEFARSSIKEASDQNKKALGYVPDYEIRVDGSPGTVERATSESRIDVEYELSSDIYLWVHNFLILNSPVGLPNDLRPGHPELYMRSHLFFVDDVLMDPESPLPPHDEAVFVNIQPYARKIERGLSSQAPDGVYDVTAALAKAKFSNLANIKFSYRTPHNFGAIHQWADTTSMQSPGRKGEKREEWLRRQPAVVIRPYAR